MGKNQEVDTVLTRDLLLAAQARISELEAAVNAQYELAQRWRKRYEKSRDLLAEAAKWMTHKRSCPPPASNFQKRKPCKCGKDELMGRIAHVADVSEIQE